MPGVLTNLKDLNSSMACFFESEVTHSGFWYFTFMRLLSYWALLFGYKQDRPELELFGTMSSS